VPAQDCAQKEPDLLVQVAAKMRGKRMEPVSWRLLIKLAVIGFLDGLKHFLESVGGVGTPGSWQILLSGLNVCATAVCCFLLLRQRFKALQLVGIALILLGGPAVIIPAFVSNDGGAIKGVVWYSVIIYALHSVPDALSSTLKELFLLQVAPITLMAVSSATEFLFGWLYAPLVVIDAFGGAPSLGSVLANGTLCFAGDPSIAVFNGPTFEGYCDHWSTWITLMYSLSHIVKNVSRLLIIYYTSAMIMMAQEAIQVPVSTLAFTIPFIGDERFVGWDILGLGLVLGGFLLYAWLELLHKGRAEQGRQEDGEQEPLLSESRGAVHPPRPGSLAIVTGANSGLGRETVKALLQVNGFGQSCGRVLPFTCFIWTGGNESGTGRSQCGQGQRGGQATS
jgi:hypothetical protein